MAERGGNQTKIPPAGMGTDGGARERRSGIARNEMMDDAEAAATLLTLKSPRPPGNLQELAWGATKHRSARGRLQD
ncbi:hypothetical protein SLA2020_020530 [Shorea laevis]